MSLPADAVDRPRGLRIEVSEVFSHSIESIVYLRLQGGAPRGIPHRSIVWRRASNAAAHDKKALAPAARLVGRRLFSRPKLTLTVSFGSMLLKTRFGGEARRGPFAGLTSHVMRRWPTQPRGGSWARLRMRLVRRSVDASVTSALSQITRGIGSHPSFSTEHVASTRPPHPRKSRHPTYRSPAATLQRWCSSR